MTNQSPCANCQSPVDKTICTKSGRCARLLAYEDGEPDEYILAEPIPTAEELGVPNQPNSSGATRNAGSPSGKKSATKICEIKGCDTKIVARGLCLKHYDLWHGGKLPGYPPFKRKQFHKCKKTAPKKKVVKKTTAKKPEQRPKTPTPPPNFFFPVDLTDYPAMRDVIVKTAARFLVPPQHVIISLVGEGLAARQQRG